MRANRAGRKEVWAVVEGEVIGVSTRVGKAEKRCVCVWGGAFIILTSGSRSLSDYGELVTSHYFAHRHRRRRFGGSAEFVVKVAPRASCSVSHDEAR